MIKYNNNNNNNNNNNKYTEKENKFLLIHFQRDATLHSLFISGKLF